MGRKYIHTFFLYFLVEMIDIKGLIGWILHFEPSLSTCLNCLRANITKLSEIFYEDSGTTSPVQYEHQQQLDLEH